MEKIVRDKIREFSLQENDGRKFRKANTPTELGLFLAMKVQEEAGELSHEAVTDNNDALIEETGDLLAAVDALLAHKRIPMNKVLWARMKKAERKGEFEQGWIMELPEGGV
jgi:predicted house-cleaning noncanonical NTP pyrophosphatase (MazG superfamily)